MADLAIFQDKKHKVSLIKDEKRETLWASQKQIADIFGVQISAISKHAKNIFDSEELNKKAVISKMEITADDGKKYSTNVYNLDMIIAIGYRVNSRQATVFRQWATHIIREFALNGAVIDPGRVSPKKLAMALRKLRCEEKSFYAVIRDVFKASATDYDTAPIAARSKFFAIAQDKLHYAILNKTSAQIVLERSNARKKNAGLITFTGDNPTTTDVIVGKNYLSESELEELEILCENFLGFCHLKAFRGQQMTFEEITHKINSFLEFNGYEVLYEYNQPLRKRADIHAKEELKKYKEKLKLKRKEKGVGVGG